MNCDTFFDLDLVSTFLSQLSPELLGQVFAILAPLVSVDVFIARYGKFTDDADHLEIPDSEGDVSERREREDVTLTGRHANMCHLGLRKCDYWHHGFSTEENYLVRFEHDHVGALRTPLNRFLSRTFKRRYRLVRLAVLCPGSVELIDDNILAISVEVLRLLVHNIYCITDIDIKYCLLCF